MTTTEADLLSTYHAALIDHVRANPAETVEDAIAATLPDYLEWEGTGYSGALRGSSHGGGMAPEGAGFDTFELDRKNTPAWAVEHFDGLSPELQEQITTEAEEAEIERMQP